MRFGPVDVLVIAMGEPKFDGTIMAELAAQAQAGTISVLDAMVLLKDVDGTEMTFDIEDLAPEDREIFGFIDTGTRGLLDAEDSAVLFEGMVPGSAVVALAIEHTWAVGLVNAVYEAGAEVAMTMRIPSVVVDEAYASLTGA